MKKSTTVGAISALTLSAMAGGAMAAMASSEGSSIAPSVSEAHTVIENAFTDGSLDVLTVESFVIAEGASASSGGGFA